MSRIQTQLLFSQSENAWVDHVNPGLKWVKVETGGSTWTMTEYDHTTGDIMGTINGMVGPGSSYAVFSNGDTVYDTGLFSFAEGQPNRFQTPDVGPTPTPTVEKKPYVITPDSVKHLLLRAADVYGTTDRITVTTNADQSVTIDLSSDLTFEALHVLGDAAVDGALSAASVSSTGAVSAGSLSATSSVTAASVTATGQVTAGHLALDVYPAGQTPPAPPAGKAVFFMQEVSV